MHLLKLILIKLDKSFLNVQRIFERKVFKKLYYIKHQKRVM